MLDQNTDRMWYVIGAVIVGAAIILILNGTMPQIFASVAETFEDKTEEVTTVTDGIMLMQKNVNLVDTSQFTRGWISSTTGEYFSSESDMHHNYTTHFIPVGDYDHITISLYDSISNHHSSHSGSGWFYDVNIDLLSPGVVLMEWSEPTSETVAVPEGAVYYRHNLIYGDEYRYKIEAGTESTPW